MSVLTSQLNPRSADFQANAAHMQLAVDAFAHVLQQLATETA